MERTATRWLQTIVGLLLLSMGLGVGAPGSGVAAQESAIDCAPATPAAPAASPAASTMAVASPVAFATAGGDLTVFAAASLTDAFGKMKTDLEAAHPGLTITYNFAGSQTLATQLQQGAHADVFASANDAQMQAAQADGSIVGAPAPFVRNKLVIVTPLANPAGIAAPADLAKPGLKLVLALPAVPAGNYARQAICRMGADPAAYGADFASKVSANVVSQEEDVRAVLTKVQLGEADAGIVYVSDAIAVKGKVRQVAIPDAVNPTATYPIAAVAGGDERLAAAFIAYVLSPQGQQTLADYGFTPAS
ncbi:MAG TPA: molybdate ABC transporter substrate-binding protein [Thermomicrobiales bacterium]|nr:molybdate ABC transporter substrate-binding protein [Thermomicrobiales bacterium]